MLKKIRELRQSKGIEVKELVKLLGYKSEATYYKKELGYTRFSLREAKKIAELFDANIEDIFFEDELAKIE